ncbi:hypothetical protein MPTK1_2g24940 [Marchantia polymorpha subsp. ruderalis]|nr:hypothetical protein MARPO_0181s0003 [Marchantia polymorpha]BBN03623.1 hypothetical protein Mp_2g24940 [Marchantia polymorpha subsp. ruderalis]|eukprot:PTQ27852.1 hypothetical protein MARPO_0181s0003 [Marchantia polymorpha]
MCTMGSTPVLCETYCEAYGDYLYCISGAISWSQCLSGSFDSPPTYGYPYFSPPTFIDESDADTGVGKSKTGLIAGAIAGGIAGTAVFFLIALLLYCYCRRLHPKPRKGAGEKSLKRDGASSKDSLASSKVVSVRHLEVSVLASDETVVPGHGPASVAPVTKPRKQAMFVSLEEVRTATSTTNYSKKYLIGEGRFGSVYYGRLVTGDEVAVKVNSYKGHQSLKDFKSEVSILSGLHHPNVVSLVGFCDEHQNRMLIFEFMPKKTLRHHLYGPGLKDPLDWRTRLQVAAHAARGLEYLHHECQPAIVHGDIKTSNILLNDKYVAKVADLDISKLVPEASSPKLDNREFYPPFDSSSSSRLPYYDPELLAGDVPGEGTGSKPRTTKSDVYSFGVALLEIICGKPPRDVVHRSSIVHWARDIIKAGSVEKLADPTLDGTYDIDVLWKVAELAMTCVAPLGMHRPDAKQVVVTLTEAIELQTAASATDKASVTAVEPNQVSPHASDAQEPLRVESGARPLQ